MKLTLVFLAALIVTIQCLPAQKSEDVKRSSGQGPRVPLHRYYLKDGSDHFYTTNANEIGTTDPGEIGKDGYEYEGIAAFVYTSRVENTVPLYRYWNGNIKDHFYTTDLNELNAGGKGYEFEGIAAYCHGNSLPGVNRPFHRYWNGVDHFYTLSPSEIGTTIIGARGNYGYVYEGIACYVSISPRDN